jgi:serine phosphatase RsbU (regulator of sigma subunit)
VDFTLTGTIDGALRVWKIVEGENRVGRDPNVAISISDQSVSRKHAIVRRVGDEVFVEDTASSNGTTINGAAVKEPRRLQADDNVAFGKVLLRFSAQSTHPSLGDDSRLVPEISLEWADVRPASKPGASATPLDDLSDIGDFLVRRQSQEEILDVCLTWVERLVPFHRACLLLLNAEGQPEVRAARTADKSADAKSLALSHTMVNRVIHDRSALLVRDARSDERFSIMKSVMYSRIRSALVAPLFDNASVIGVLYVDYSEIAGVYDREHLRRFALLANMLAVKITNARLIEAEREQERLRQEMETAARIQRALLPRNPFCPAGYEMAARLVPSTEVAGDLYDTVRLPDGRALFVVGDVSGHGVGAALLMANAIAAVRALAGLTGDPVDLVHRIHEQMCATDTFSYVTMFAGILDPERHRLTYVNAGHEYPALILPGQPVERLASTSPPVGLLPDVTFESASVEFPPGALLGIWTDGISEAHIPDANSAGPPHLFSNVQPIDALLARLYDRPIQDIETEVFGAVDRFLDRRHAPDDATLFLLRRLR